MSLRESFELSECAVTIPFLASAIRGFWSGTDTSYSQNTNKHWDHLGPKKVSGGFFKSPFLWYKPFSPKTKITVRVNWVLSQSSAEKTCILTFTWMLLWHLPTHSFHSMKRILAIYPGLCWYTCGGKTVATHQGMDMETVVSGVWYQDISSGSSGLQEGASVNQACSISSAINRWDWDLRSLKRRSTPWVRLLRCGGVLSSEVRERLQLLCLC